MGAEEPTLRNHLSLTERVYVALREMIMNLELPPGTRLKDVDLAKRLGVSNTPVREAIRWLAADSLVKTSPRRGTFVCRLTSEDYRKLSEIRESLEVLAVQRTAERASDQALKEIAEAAALHMKAVESGTTQEYLVLDRQFHILIAEASGNEILVSMLNSLSDRIQIARRLDLNREHDLVSGREHQAIAAALVSRNGEKAVELITRHIREHRDQILALLPPSTTMGEAIQALSV